MIAKRERGKLERRLVASLTHACEQAKPLLPGFCWLTHEARRRLAAASRLQANETLTWPARSRAPVCRYASFPKAYARVEGGLRCCR